MKIIVPSYILTRYWWTCYSQSFPGITIKVLYPQHWLDTAKIQIYRPILNWEANVRHTQIGWVQFTSCNFDFIHNSKWQIQESPGTAAKRDFSFFSPKNGQKGLAFGLSASYRMPWFWVGRLNKPSKTTIEFGKSCQWQWMWNII